MPRRKTALVTRSTSGTPLVDKQIPDTQGGGALGPEVVSRLARGKRGGRSVRAVAERAPMPRAILNRPA